MYFLCESKKVCHSIKYEETDFILKGVIMSSKEKVPIYQKQNLTLEEAAEYSNIGINRLRILISNPHCPFALTVGNKRLIKRKQFDKFVENVDCL